MPKQVLPDAMSFAAFSRALERRGFRKLSCGEFRSDFRRLALRAPQMRQGRETGFVFMANGLKVQVWTTFVEAEGCAREHDAGWVLIKQGDKIRYSSRPHHRTQNYLYNLLLSACVARQRVLHRPLCPKCASRMNIAFGKGLKARYWQCLRRDGHDDGKVTSVDWDFGLPDDVLAFVERNRKKRAQYRKELRRKGKSAGVAMSQRKRWVVRKPQNLVEAY